MGYHDGLRAWKEDSSGNRTYFLYDGINIVCELDEDGYVVATNTYGANGLIARNDGEESVVYTFDDGGNVIQLIDDTGTVITTDQYDAYGNRIAGTNDTPYGYQGQYGYYTDSETGLILATNRYYDPTEGRWLTRDPIGYAGGLNLYGYCGNNPVNYSDPLGLCEDGKPWMGYIHTGLDVIGLIPGIGEIADGANALLYLYEGDYLNAAISGVSALGGDGAKLLRGGSNLVGGAGFVVKHGDEAGDLLKHVDDAADAGKRIWTPGKPGNPVENAYDHWKRHGTDFPENQNSKEYVEKTHEFLSNPPPGSEFKSRPNGDTLIYDPETNTFGIKDINGTPRTRYKPKEGAEYWKEVR